MRFVKIVFPKRAAYFGAQYRGNTNKVARSCLSYDRIHRRLLGSLMLPCGIFLALDYSFIQPSIFGVQTLGIDLEGKRIAQYKSESTVSITECHSKHPKSLSVACFWSCSVG